MKSSLNKRKGMMMKRLWILIALCSTLVSAQTPNVNIPKTPRFRFNMYRAHLDTVKAGDTTNTAPTNVGFNGNMLKIDSILNVHGSHDSLVQQSYTSTGGWFGDGSDGNVTVSGTTTLSRDMFYQTLTITGSLLPAGFRIHADSIFIGSAGLIADTGLAGNVGGNGTAGTNPATPGVGGTGGAAQTGLADAYLYRHLTTAATINGQGANGTQSGNASAGTAGQAQTGFVGVAGSAGGAGGNASDTYTGGSGGGAGTTTGTAAIVGGVRDFWALYSDRAISSTPTITAFRWVGFSGGGGGGAGSNGFDNAYGGGGAGGGAGQPGGFVWIAARVITGTGAIRASGGKGGNGGNGGNGGDATKNAGGGGGGGGGGAGGVLALFNHSIASTITLDVSGGVGGTKGTKGIGRGSPTDGVNGTNGNTGLLFRIKF